MKQQAKMFTFDIMNMNMESSNNSNTPQDKLRKISFDVDQPNMSYLATTKVQFVNNNQWGIKGWSDKINQEKFSISQKVKTQRIVSNKKYSYRVSVKHLDRKSYIEKLQEKLLLLKQMKTKGQIQKKVQIKQEILQKLPQIGLNPQKSRKNVQFDNLMNLPENNYNFTAKKISSSPTKNVHSNSFKPLKFYTTLLRKNSNEFSQISKHSRSLSHTKDQVSFINYPMMTQQKKKSKGFKKIIRLQDYMKYQTQKQPIAKTKTPQQKDNQKQWTDL